MISSKLFIPTKLKVGFQNRKDTFTGKLAYVIYYDEKGKLRKETSWKSWCNENIPAIELDNNPRAGYVLNKGIQRWSDWGTSVAKVRVHDPRDFEFEIDIHNLLGILMHSDVAKRDIQQECVFAWNGTDLVLLPTNSQEYQDSIKYTAKQSNKVSAKELKVGWKYVKKKGDDQTEFMYVGYFNYWDVEQSYYNNGQKDKGKRHVFYDGKNYVIPAVNLLSHNITDECDADYASILEKFQLSLHGSKVVRIEQKPGTFKKASYSCGGHLYKIDDQNTIVDVYVSGNTDETVNGLERVTFSYHTAWYEQNGFDIEESKYKKYRTASRAKGFTKDEYQDDFKKEHGYSYYNRREDWAKPNLEIADFAKRVPYTTKKDSYNRENLVMQLSDIKTVLEEMGFSKLVLVTENGGKHIYRNDY